MAIKLNKPLGSDIYSISVHNDNSTQIEEAVNGLLIDVEDIKRVLPTKFDYKQIDILDVRTVSGNAIYFISGALTGDVPTSDLPSGGNIIISYYSEDVQVKTLITGDGRIFQKNSTEGIWKALTASVVDNLITDDSLQSLSARQGKILNDKKLDITILTSGDTLDINNTDSGAFIGSTNISITGDIPSVVKQLENFVLLSLGNIGDMCVQICWIANQKCSYSRYGYADENGDFSFSDWKSDGSGAGGGIDLSEIYQRLSTIEQNITTINNNYTVLKKQVDDMAAGGGGGGSSADVEQLKKDVAQLKTDVTTLKNNQITIELIEV